MGKNGGGFPAREMTLALLTYGIPPMRALHWLAMESDETEPTAAEADVRAYAAERGWTVQSIKLNPPPEDVPEHLREHFQP